MEWYGGVRLTSIADEQSCLTLSIFLSCNCRKLPASGITCRCSLRCSLVAKMFWRVCNSKPGRARAWV